MNERKKPPALQNASVDFLAGGGEMGERIRAKDWSQTPLGPVEQWPQSLKTIVRIMLTSRQPIWIGWGPELIKLYNDPYKAIVGGKHPEALGQPASVVWREIWDDLAPRLETAYQNNEGTYDEALRLIMERNGYPEETYYTFSYSPVPADEGGVGGIICANTDDTQRIIGERQVKLLRTLAAATADARTVEDACRLGASSLAQNPYDLPFALLYLLDQEQRQARLAGAAGIHKGYLAAPENVALDEDGLWPFEEAQRTGKMCLISNLDHLVERLPTGIWKRPPHQAVAVPIASVGQMGQAGMLIAGLNPYRLFDEGYQGFIQLVGGELAASLANAHAYEEERKRAEALAEIDRAKTAFFSNVSHEFRTPLTLMLAPIEDMLAEQQGLPPAQRERTELLHRNTLRLLRLVNTLLDFSRIEAGRIEAVYTPTDLATLTADLASAFRSLMEKAGLQLVVDCQNLSEPVYVDRAMWEKIVLNLLSNAFKFTLTGTVTVTLRQKQQQAQLIVRDTGTGIPPDALPRLFERFHRVQGARARTYEGSGIGLALVQELVHIHGGTITVESQVGAGTTFTVTLPLGPAHLPAEHIQASQKRGSAALGAAPFIEEAQRWLPEDAPGGTSAWLRDGTPPLPAALAPLRKNTARILLADDNADMRTYLKRLLGEYYEVEAVADGVAALQAARQHAPDLVVSDVMMPELDGFGLLRELRADPRTRAIPVILLSARAGEEATIEGLKAGADDYLVKPFSAREILARVTAHLEMARLRQEASERSREVEAVFDTMPDGMDIIDANGKILHMNRAGQQMLGGADSEEAHAFFAGYPQDRARLLHMRDAQGNPLPEERLPHLRIVQQGETLVGATTVEVLVRTLDGREREWSYGGAPIRNALGQISGGVIAFWDITERRALERRTQQALAALLQLVESVVTTQDTSSAENTPQELVQATQSVFGCEIVSMVQIDPKTWQLTPLATCGRTDEEGRGWLENLARYRLDQYFTPEQIHSFRYGEIVIPNYQHMTERGMPVYGMGGGANMPLIDQGQLVGLLALGFRSPHHTFTPDEMTLLAGLARLASLFLQRERLLRERAEAQAHMLALKETNERMDEFISIAGHELRTPVTAIKSSIQLTLRRLEREGQDGIANQGSPPTLRPDILQRTDRQIQRLIRLLDDMLDLSRIRAGKLELRPELCDLATLVREIAESEAMAHPERSIRLEGASNGSIPIRGDSDRIGQVITNYLTNALKYSAVDQPVTVRVRHNTQTATVEVQDQGPGIPPAEQSRIWELFHRVPGIHVQSGSGVGLGLGLHISKTLIERHNGQVGVTSAPGQGSTFWFTLSLANEATMRD
jgi:signal transduction histidine kinase/FixJ family two-component response regulator